MAGKKARAIVVERGAAAVTVRAADGGVLPAHVIANTRDAGFWAVFRGPDPGTATAPLSAGYESEEEAIAAARAWVSCDRQVLPRAEAKGFCRDRRSPWVLFDLELMFPAAPGVLATIDNAETGERRAILLTDAELARIGREWQRGGRPHVGFPPRRLLSQAEAYELRLTRFRDQLAESGILAMLSASLPGEEPREEPREEPFD